MQLIKKWFGPAQAVESDPKVSPKTVLYLIERQGEIGLSSHDLQQMLCLKDDAQGRSEMMQIIGELLTEGKIYHVVGSSIYIAIPDGSTHNHRLSLHRDQYITNTLNAEKEFAHMVTRLTLLELFVLYVAAKGSGFRLTKDDRTEGNAFIDELNEVAYDFVNNNLTQDPIPMFNDDTLPDKYVESLDQQGFFEPRKVYQTKDGTKQSNTYRLKSVYLRTYLVRQAPDLIHQLVEFMES